MKNFKCTAKNGKNVVLRDFSQHADKKTAETDFNKKAADYVAAQKGTKLEGLKVEDLTIEVKEIQTAEYTENTLPEPEPEV